MKVLGIHVHKGALRYAVLSGTKKSPKLISNGRLITPDPTHVPALMDWFDSQYRRLMDDNSPDRICYRLTLDPKKEQLFFSEFPLGILNLIAHQYGAQIKGTSKNSWALAESMVG